MAVRRTFYQNRDQIKMFRICACFTIDSFVKNRILNLLIVVDVVNDPTHILTICIAMKSDLIFGSFQMHNITMEYITLTIAFRFPGTDAVKPLVN